VTLNTKDSPLVKQIQQTITDEVFFALGLKRTGFWRKALGWLFHLPTHRFAKMMAEVDQATENGGLPAGCQTMSNFLNVQTSVKGDENIPISGPAIILSNHPGAYDSIALGACVKRLDLKFIVGETRLYHALPHIQPRLIMVSLDASQTMLALRQAIDHLQQGGILLQFGSGLIEPDPSIRPVGDDVFAKWSRSLEIMLRKVPQTRVVPAIASGVLQERFASHPLTRLRRDAMDKRRLAEFTQVIQQLIWPASIKARPRISFGHPMDFDSLESQAQGKTIMEFVIMQMKAELATHLEWVRKTSLS
jgi:hypothetical protein